MSETGHQLSFVDVPPTAQVSKRSRASGQRKEWNSNRLLPEDRPVHDWYRFVLSFPPHLVRRYAELFDLDGSHCVLDPFCGTGTTLIECKKLGIPSLGVEANPMAFFASKVKCSWNIDPEKLVAHANKVARATTSMLKSRGIRDTFFFDADPPPANELRQLSPEMTKLLLKDSISPLPLHKTLILLDYMGSLSEAPFSDYERLALAKALVGGIGNLRFGPEVGVGPKKSDAPVVAPWREIILSMSKDITALRGYRETPATVYFDDARERLSYARPNSIDAVITSPPYPNEKDYTRTTRLESVLLGFITDRRELQAFKRRLIRSNTRNVYKQDTDDKWVLENKDIQEISDRIEEERIRLGKTSGFERMYSRVSRLYFGGMARHFGELRAVLKPGARLAYVVGDQACYLRVMIRTGELLGQVAESLGYEVLDRELFRTRTATATGEQLREEVLILRWPGN